MISDAHYSYLLLEVSDSLMVVLPVFLSLLIHLSDYISDTLFQVLLVPK